jgi:hypothetical protein
MFPLYKAIPMRKEVSISTGLAYVMSCEMPTVYIYDTPIARKEHKCCECRGIINKGEKYNKHHGIWDGEGSTFKVCSDCEELRAQMNHGLPSDECVYFGGVVEHAFESNCVEYMRAVIETKEKRHGPVHYWMIEQFDDEINKEDEKDEEKVLTGEQVEIITEE